jgi:hypothetical protein
MGTQTDVIRAKRPASIACRKCGNRARVNSPNVTSRITEVLDNGFMTKKIERPADAERLYREKADVDRPKKPE